jgi:hypothetical protein
MWALGIPPPWFPIWASHAAKSRDGDWRSRVPEEREINIKWKGQTKGPA